MMNELAKIDAHSNVNAYRASTEAAALCKEIVVATSTMIQRRRYVSVEGWQAIARAHGAAAGACDVERVEGGVRAIGEVRDIVTGALIARAEGFVGEDEPTWYGGVVNGRTLPRRADYAIRAMAQTRAMSRACRSAFAHVVIMMNAGLATTPLEETHDPITGEILQAVSVPVVPITDAQRDLIATLAPAAGKTLQDICHAYKIDALPELSYAQAASVINRLSAVKESA